MARAGRGGCGAPARRRAAAPRRDRRAARQGSAVSNGVGLWLELVRAPPSGTWERRRADLYAAAEDWLGPASVTAEEAIELLVRRYLGGFGPALAQRDRRLGRAAAATSRAPALERLAPAPLPRRGRRGAARPSPRAAARSRDARARRASCRSGTRRCSSHARRTGILPERYRPASSTSRPRTRCPRSWSTAQVAGTWRYEKGRVRLKPFGRLTAAARRELGVEAERLAAFHA